MVNNKCFMPAPTLYARESEDKDTAKTVLSTATTLMVGAYVAKKMGESDKFMKTFGLDSDEAYNKRMFERFTGLGKKK